MGMSSTREVSHAGAGVEQAEGSMQLQPLAGGLSGQNGGKALGRFPHLEGCTPLGLPADAQVWLLLPEPVKICPCQCCSYDVVRSCLRCPRSHSGQQQPPSACACDLMPSPHQQ